MTDFVLDASAALSWCFEDETTAAADRLLERLETEAAAVPSLWHIEVANIIAMGERRGRLTPAKAAGFFAVLEKLTIVVDESTASHAFGPILDLARRERLTAYDAAYLELAMRLGVPLASKDADLCDAAERLGVNVYRAG